MENLSKDLKDLIYDYIYGNKESWMKYYKKNVIKEYNEIIEGITHGIILLCEILPICINDDKKNYLNMKNFVENNPQILLKSIKEYSI